jgi:hypothetical protein
MHPDDYPVLPSFNFHKFYDDNVKRLHAIRGYLMVSFLIHFIINSWCLINEIKKNHIETEK